MKLHALLNCTRSALVLLAITASSAHATIITANNAGSTLATAQVIPGGAANLTDIIGTINNNINQVELFKIFLTAGTTFSATTVSNTSNFFDTELFLLNSAGVGVYANDDDLNSGGTQSTLPIGDPYSPTISGFYFLGITSHGIDPISIGGAIFDIANNPSYLVLGPNGPGGASLLTGYQGTSTEQGTVGFDIGLTGVSVADTTAAAPEPSYAFFLPLMGGLFLVIRKWKVIRRSNLAAAAVVVLGVTGLLSAQPRATNLAGGLAELRDAYDERVAEAASRGGSVPQVLTLTKDIATGKYSNDSRLSRINVDSANRVMVQIFLDGTVPATVIERAVTRSGGRHVATDTKWRNGVVDAYIPLSSVDALASTPGVRSMTLTPKLRTRTTPVPVGTQSGNGMGPGNTPGTNLQHTDQANANGITGAGITVAVTSDSFNANGHAATEISQGLLPAAGVTVINDAASGSDEGNAMLQLVHDVAPGAKLCFAAAQGSHSLFANNIRSMRTNPACLADIIADDIGFGDEPFFSDGQEAEAVQEVVTNTTLSGAPAGLAGKNVSYFVYGGNDGNIAFQTTFSLTTDSAARALSPVLLHNINGSLTSGGFQNFGTAANPSVAFPVGFGATNSGSLTLFWDDLFNANAVTTDYNLFVVDSSGNIIASSAANNISNDQPIELINVTNSGNTIKNYFIVISRTSAGSHAANRLLLLSNDNGNNGVILPPGISGPTVFGHSSAAAGIAVAAVDFGEQASAPFYPFLTSYNSRGPVTITFDGNNNRLATASVRKKPDMSAIVNNTVAFFEGQPTAQFPGTSAAAPQNAGIAALMLQKAGGPGSLTPAQVKSYMQASGPSRDVDLFTATANGSGLKVISTDTVPELYSTFEPPFAFDTTYAVSFSTAGQQLSSLKIDLTGVQGSFETGTFPLKTDSSSAGITLVSSTVSGVNNGILTLNFTGFNAGGQFTFDVGSYAPFPNPLTLVIGGFSDVISGVPVTATLSNATTVTAAFSNVIGKAWTQYDGFGIVNALTALSKIQ